MLRGWYRASLDERSHICCGSDDIVILVDVWYQLTHVNLDNKPLKRVHLCVTLYLVKLKFNLGVQAIFQKYLSYITQLLTTAYCCR